MNENFLYKCTDCGTVQATSEDLGESSWIMNCFSSRCQGMIKESFRLDLIEGKVICQKEVMCDDSDEDEIEKIDEYRSEHK